MLKITLVLIIFIALNKNGNTQTSDSNIQTYDSLLAKKYGADDYGMKQFIMAFLKSGKNILTDKAEEDRLQSEHMKNINKMAEDGKLVIAGPFMDNQSLKGIYIFDVRTLEEARELTSTDPAVKAGVLEMELHPWYGSAALLEINNIHNKIQKKSF
ncbi:MAG: hypothetical protein IPG09_18075 [Ignavibacteria bacterium]|nr:hypothetical protein [Ignavibacteria bacterium]